MRWQAWRKFRCITILRVSGLFNLVHGLSFLFTRVINSDMAFTVPLLITAFLRTTAPVEAPFFFIYVRGTPALLAIENGSTGPLFIPPFVTLSLLDVFCLDTLMGSIGGRDIPTLSTSSLSALKKLSGGPLLIPSFMTFLGFLDVLCLGYCDRLDRRSRYIILVYIIPVCLAKFVKRTTFRSDCIENGLLRPWQPQIFSGELAQIDNFNILIPMQLC